MQRGNASPRQLVLGTAGHVDHGKTTLIRALTGIDCDRLAEEKQRGLTIDIGFAHLDLGEIHLGVVDVPGHERFVKNMLAGAAGIDLALLVVAADDAIMPQTREHLAILQLLGVEQGVIAISKTDRVEPAWLEMVEDEVRGLVQDTFLAKAPLVRCAVPPQGASQGMEALRQALVDTCGQVVQRRTGAPFRLPIDRGFTVAGQGAIVTGTVWSGELVDGDTVEWLPADQMLHVRSLQSHWKPVRQLERGQRGAVNLSGVDYSQLHRGQELAAPGYLKPRRLLSVELTVLPDSGGGIKHRSKQRVHLATQEVMATVELLEDVSCVNPGQTVLAQLRCADEVMAVTGQTFIVRAESPLVTIGGGTVLQPCAARVSRKQADRIARIGQLRSTDPATRAAAAIYFYRGRPWTDLDLCRDAAVDLPSCPAVIRQLIEQGQVVVVEQGSERLLVHADIIQEATAVVEQTAGKMHAQSPLQPTLPRAQLVATCQRLLPLAVVEHTVNRLCRLEVLRGNGQRIALASFTPSVTPAQQDLLDKLLAVLRAAGTLPPGVKELANKVATDEKEVRRILRLLAADGGAVRLTDEIYLHAEVFHEICAILRQQFQSSAGMTVSQIRDAIGTSRKYAVPLCEYLDKVGFTRRQGDLRVPFSDPIRS